MVAASLPRRRAISSKHRCRSFGNGLQVLDPEGSRKEQGLEHVLDVIAKLPGAGGLPAFVASAVEFRGGGGELCPPVAYGRRGGVVEGAFAQRCKGLFS